MKIDPKTGKIAYHSIRFREDGTGSDLVQYDFDGKVESITPHTEYPQVHYDPKKHIAP